MQALGFRVEDAPDYLVEKLERHWCEPDGIVWETLDSDDYLG